MHSNPGIYPEYILDLPFYFKQRFTIKLALGGRYRFGDAYSVFLEFGLGISLLLQRRDKGSLLIGL